MEYAAISKKESIMKKFLFLSLFIALVTITLDTQCMLTRLARQGNLRARSILLQRRWCTNNINYQDATRRISVLETIRSVHAQQIDVINFEIAQLKQIQPSAQSSSLLPDYNRHHSTEATAEHDHDSYLPDYNMHYGNRNHDHKQ